MTETKWTPGPFRLVVEAHQWTIAPQSKPADEVYGVACYESPDLITDEEVSNGILFAAAPDLYDALDRVVDGEFASEQEWVKWRDEARKALAKARGES